MEVPDPGHPTHEFTRGLKSGFAHRLADVARDPDLPGAPLALLHDGAAARSVALNSLDTLDTASQIAEIVLDAELSTRRTPALAGR